MSDKPMFTTFWTNESATTAKVLARIPEGSDYRPDPKSRTAQEIAWAIVCEEKMIIEALESGKAEWAPPPMPATMKEVVDAYEKQSADIIARWKALPDARWNGQLDFFGTRASRVADGVELPLRHRPSPRPDQHLPAADGIDGAADLRAERRRAVTDGNPG